ncbi:hypothetical protein FA95DRAFT_1574752 [Auriscalpium vulgare]|uniref:Uncharacterized protein n=1 Tax=Auriscalpium vulgare TaxID=40419 RepID=A0ACB8RJX6_9AGAM|nr:hypothetical protein FA95DRAFT_1574752 [Auriscalpium vulgare]
MAALALLSAFHAPQSRHFLPHNDYELHPVGAQAHAAPQHNGFEAFSHRHGHARGHRQTRSPSPASVTASWRVHAPAEPSHAHTPSEDWRAHSHSRVPHTVSPATAVVPLPKDVRSASPAPAVYSATELLRLASSPLVGLSDESQAVVEDLVAHHVWRRGPRSASSSRSPSRNSRSRSRKPSPNSKRTSISSFTDGESSN